MLRPAKHRRECRRLFKHLGQPFAVLKRSFLGENTLGRLADDAEDSADAAAFIWHGGIADVEVNGLRIAVPLDIKGTILGVDSLARVPNALKERAQIVPQLRPVFSGRTPERARMLVADRWRVSVIVKGDEFRSPEEHDLRGRGQDQADCGLQTLGPSIQRANWRVRPVAAPDQALHLAHFGFSRMRLVRTGERGGDRVGHSGLYAATARRLISYHPPELRTESWKDDKARISLAQRG